MSAQLNVDANIVGVKKNIERKFSHIQSLTADGGVVLSHGEVLENINTVILATGYHFNFDFLKISEEDLTWKENKITPLYHHIFYVKDPSLTFIGIPWTVLPFILM